MKTDRPPTIAERSVSYDKEPCSVSPGIPVLRRVLVKLSSDRTPIKPLRRSWNTGETSKPEGTTGVQLLSSTEDENSADHSSLYSDLTDPSEFYSLNNASFNSSFSNMDSLRQQDGLDVSLRIETLGPLDEEKGDCEWFGHLDREGMPSSSKDRAAFATDCNDSPPEIAKRMYSYSSMDWTVDSEPMSDRFEKIAPGDQDKPMTLPKPSYSQKGSLAKLAEAFKSGCTVGTHTYHLKKYPNTFVGSEAVDFMLNVNLASTREDAVFLGQQFCKELNLFHHVCWDHTFKDGHFFYRFNDGFAKDTRCVTPISRKELVTLSEKFVEGMPVSRHMSSRFKSHSNTFSGEEAVDHMLRAKLAWNRPAAVFLGQRMMEELDIFDSVAHKSRFKDSCHLYRFVTGDNTDHSYSDESADIMSLIESDRAQHQQDTRLGPLPSAKTPQSGVLAPAIVEKRKNHGVSFGLVQSRYFERCPECNPATTSGPSLGLGWRFYDDSPVSLGDGRGEALKVRGGRLSVQDRTTILKEWGYSRADINKAARAIKVLRQQRKRSLNRDRGRY